MSMPTDFEWSYTDEPHATRRQLIKKAHPEVSTLMGPFWGTKWLVMGAVAIQVFMCSAVRDLTWPWLILCAYTIGGVINHSMTLAMHEISHNLAFRSLNMNRLFSYIANLPLGIPSAAQFKRYHREHHKYQGEDGVDTDIPTKTETSVVTNSVMKVLFVFCQPLFYALRPMVMVPKKPGLQEAINYTMVFGFDAVIGYFFGVKAVVYLIAGTLLGMGLHPMAGHFIAEHYTFVKGQETYSYYGPLNWFSFNVGYHNEHHDFPNIPGYRLPALRKMAPEFYDNMPHHSSWMKVIVEYIMDPTVGPFSRIKRDRMEPSRKAKLMAGQDQY